MLADSLGWVFLKKVTTPILMMSRTGVSDAKFLVQKDDMVKTYNAIGSKFRVYGKGIEHGDMLMREDAYTTAWMLYWLHKDQQAGQCFKGLTAEILKNSDWQDVMRKNVIKNRPNIYCYYRQQTTCDKSC